MGSEDEHKHTHLSTSVVRVTAIEPCSAGTTAKQMSNINQMFPAKHMIPQMARPDLCCFTRLSSKLKKNRGAHLGGSVS